MKTLATGVLLIALTMPLGGCIPMAIGYLVAKSLEKPAVTTTTCVKQDDGTSQCTTTTKP